MATRAGKIIGTSSPRSEGGLFAGGSELSGNVGECRLKLCPERVYHGYDGDRNAGRYEAVLDGGGSGFVVQQIYKAAHFARSMT